VTAASVVTVQVTGELTIHAAAEQKARLVGALEQADGLRLDLAQVSELDSAGLQILLLLRREAAAAGKAFSLTGHPQGVLDVLALASRSAQLADLSDPDPVAQSPDPTEGDPR
jgi:anti-anti-sigma factor